jgi:hypothetical protein
MIMRKADVLKITRHGTNASGAPLASLTTNDATPSRWTAMAVKNVVWVRLTPKEHNENSILHDQDGAAAYKEGAQFQMQNPTEATNKGGILINEGASFRLSGLSISFNKTTGEVTLDGGTAMLHYDVCPVWLSIALEHLKIAKAAHEQLLSARDSKNDEERRRALEHEFRASMQVATSAAIAIDAFYAVIKRNLAPDAEPYNPEKRTARFARVSETIRQAFQLKQKGFDAIRQQVEQIFKWRDQAVHPSADFSTPILHPDLECGVERRLVIFSYDNAFKILQSTVNILSQLAANGKAKNVPIEKYASYLKTKTSVIRADVLLELPPLPNDSE